ncbi:MAG: hypothetical protein ACR2IH_07225 [Pyrinomonadaceae bacterium]
MLEGISRKGPRAVAMQMGLILVVLSWTTAASAQNNDNAQTAATTATQSQQSRTPKTVKMPALQNYKGVKIGSTPDEVRDKLGKAVIDDKDGFYYEFDNEIVQIRIGADKKLRLIARTYSSKNKNTPTLEDGFGANVTATPSADGTIHRLIRYPAAGYWVAYSRTAGDKPSVTVTMQKL